MIETVQHDRIYVGGAWVTPDTDAFATVVNPATELEIGRVPLGTASDVDAAVAAARDAADTWARTPAAHRAAALRTVAAEIRARGAELALLASNEVGTPITVARSAHVALPAHSFETAAHLIEAAGDDSYEQVGNSRVYREPYGVVGAITPWNYPLHQSAAKIAPAVAAGNTVVFKPSEVAPLTSWVLADIISAAGFPPGVFNMVSGAGATVGHRIAEHPDVALVSFTGSTRAGISVARTASATVKKVSLELGGKGSAVFLPGTDLATAVPATMAQSLLNSGQTCMALTRLIVHEGDLREFESRVRSAVEALRIGDPVSEETELGPVTTGAQYAVVQRYITIGLDENLALVTGGTGRPAGLDRGFFVRPTVFSRVPPTSRLVQEEIFGPVLVIQTYRHTDEAVALANGTDYGLSAGVWGPDAGRAESVARRVQAGQVTVNGGRFNPDAPFGGYKRSGIGREYGRYGLEEFQQIKSLQF